MGEQTKMFTANSMGERCYRQTEFFGYNTELNNEKNENIDMNYSLVDIIVSIQRFRKCKCIFQDTLAKCNHCGYQNT